MIAYVYILGLIISAVCVSTLGAAFSISGLAKLFSGAVLSITLMAGSLEFSKFVVAAFLHRAWDDLNRFYRLYLLSAVVVLSVITSMGIFGFLSDAYQSAAIDLSTYQIKLEAMKAEQQRNADEMTRLNEAIDEIPANRISKRILARKEAEPTLLELTKKNEALFANIREADLKILEVKQKVGPLIYISKAFDQDIDTVVKWLILVFVAVFDPLAICLVIATGEALKLKSHGRLAGNFFYNKPAGETAAPGSPSVTAPIGPMAPAATVPSPATSPSSGEAANVTPTETSVTTDSTAPIQIRFVDETQGKAG